MDYKELERLYETERNSMSDELDNVIASVLSEYDTEKVSADDALRDEINEAIDCYKDAWDYLRGQNITDFSEAINEWGAKDICSIATFYLEEELKSL